MYVAAKRHALVFSDQPERRFEVHPETRFVTMRFETSRTAEVLELLRTRPNIQFDDEALELTFEGR